MSRRLLAASSLLCAAVALAACGDITRFQTSSPTASPSKPNRTVAQTPAAEREHERILSSYGGAYDDPKLEALIGKTVDRLVAASDRPDQAYRVTILNSGAVNAFALPTGQLYVTRGLIALASGAVARDGACAGKARIDPRGPGAPGRDRHPRRYRHEQRS
jgi:predicted Zn-dependent protease